MKAQLLSRPSLVLLPAFLNAGGTAYAIREGVPTWLAAMSGILALLALGSIYRDLARRITTFRVYSHPLKGQPSEFWKTIRFKLWVYGFISIGFIFGPVYQVHHGIPIR